MSEYAPTSSGERDTPAPPSHQRPDRTVHREQDQAGLTDNHRDGVHDSRESPARSPWAGLLPWVRSQAPELRQAADGLRPEGIDVTVDSADRGPVVAPGSDREDVDYWRLTRQRWVNRVLTALDDAPAARSPH